MVNNESAVEACATELYTITYVTGVPITIEYWVWKYLTTVTDLLQIKL